MKRFLRLAFIASLAASTALHAQIPSGSTGKPGGAIPAQAEQIGGADKSNFLRTLKTGTTGGLVLGDPDNANTVSATANRALTTQQNLPVFFHTVEGTALNSQVWVTSTSTFTVAQASGLITLNSGASTSTSKYAILNSIKSIPLYGNLPLEFHGQFSTNISPEANATMEFGIGSAATTSAPTDFIGIRWSGTSMLAVVANNSVEQTAAITAPSITTIHTLRLLIRTNSVTFFVDGNQVAEIANGSGVPFPTSVARLPVLARTISGGSAPSTAPELNVGNVWVLQKDQNAPKPWSTTLSSLGRGAYQNPLTTFAQTANHANSTSPSSATLSNTAAGYTTLGGRYQFAALAGAATDYALFAYQAPAGFQTFVTRVRISAMVTGAANATTASILDWGVGINSSAVSLATTDSGNTAWAPRRIPVGMQAFLTSDAIGTTAKDIDVTFDPPLCVDGGRYFHVILQVPVMTATASEVIRGDVLIEGFSE